MRYWRFMVFRLRNPHIVTEGFVFLGRRVEVYARRGYGRLILGRWVHIGVYMNIFNPFNIGMYQFNALAQAPGDVPMAGYLGSWLIQIDPN